MRVRVGVEGSQFKEAVSDIARREERLAETVARLPHDAETYRQLPLEERLLAAASILERYIAEPFEVELEGHGYTRAWCHVSHQPLETSPGYGDTTTVKRKESIGARLHLISGVDERIQNKVSLGSVPFDYQWVGDGQENRERVKRVGRIEYDRQNQRMQLVNTAEQQDGALVEVIDAACVQIIEGSLAEQRQMLGGLVVSAEVNSQ